MKIFVLSHVGARDGLARTRAAIDQLRAADHNVSPRLLFERGDARRFSDEAIDEAADLVIAAGGDGTVHEVVNALHRRLDGPSKGAASVPRMGILPFGTGNDLAHAIGIPVNDLPAALDIATRGASQRVDVALVNDECFLNVSTGGFAAEAAEESLPEVKRTLGALAYLVSGAKKAIGLQTSYGRFVSDEVIFEGKYLLFAVGNSRRTGGGNWITPRASMTDGLLDLCIIREMPRVELLRLMPELRSGRHLDHPAVEYHQLRHVTVEAESDLAVNADGEPVHGSRFEYRVSAHRLHLMVPPEAPV